MILKGGEGGVERVGVDVEGGIWKKFFLKMMNGDSLYFRFVVIHLLYFFFFSPLLPPSPSPSPQKITHPRNSPHMGAKNIKMS